MSLFSTCKWCVSFLNWTIQLTQFSLQTLGVYKACISQVHDPVVGQQLGSLPVVSRFMKGIFQLKPTTPRSCSTWSVGPVLRHLSALEPIEKLPFKTLSLKLTILLALTSAARSHDLQHLTVTTFQGMLTVGYLLSLPMSRIQGLITLLVIFVWQNTSWNHQFGWCDAWSIIWRVPASTDNISNFYNLTSAHTSL